MLVIFFARIPSASNDDGSFWCGIGEKTRRIYEQRNEEDTEMCLREYRAMVRTQKRRN